MKFRQLMVVTISLLVLFAFTACSEDTPQKVRLAEVTRSIFYAPEYVALEKGFFAEEGLDVELTTAWGGDKTMTALLTGGADIALVGSETSVYVEVQGAIDPVINFAQLTQTDGTFLVAREKVDNFTWEQLKGSTFLGQRKGGMPQMVGEFVLKKHGIDPHNDTTLIQNIDFANIPNAFASGTGDYVQLFEPTASIFENEGKGYIVASFGTESGHVPYTTFMARDSYMKENPEVIEKFTRAVYKAQIWVQEHSAKEIAEAIAPHFQDTDLSIIETVVERYKSQGSFATDPILDEEEWNNLQDIMDEAGDLPKRIDYGTLVNTDIAKKVMAE
ncbi:ABC-type nitrate/sulfonate/bicarbonate transport system, periplasmic component [Schinkia azotoformans MEV2011]|uniref:ABC-type nitrate/sulfonate/bicarbonate transport system, periplasmic component n=1 Tax=Schinkia azotoformans MEV2011 TaxID=1348973 RepID=A0A072NIR1_SCHAZ|nr:ABC transporter substrate-binding protein [Schinkia azotoformans]KEF37579.1 ABC-type nitrate/sulfonate/bicarbonate transport system, periplasmic component [Schinkia azotoformans MEV2011]MEC1695305.1 ABC transporter substrate-binding protein [Schinkia azotoformans]MEC1724671.1 ABC transporter substrate-binding protein [Schinkia azotoformans]MEC1778009.1 ABC transporter substrate-binding protein [Schinkia azotoformans]MED4330944.1 ABC transporter substrate-binding protein [Schinkia azotoforma